MEIHLAFDVNSHIYQKNPESSTIGKRIVKFGIDLIYKLGFEKFTFNKLAKEIGSTEATIYRYFENKHRLLLYIISWYWCYMDFLMDYKLQNIKSKEEKLKQVLDLFTHELPESAGELDYNKKFLNEIVITESSKVYLIKEVSENNKDKMYSSYKQLISKISDLLLDYNPKYKYPHSLATTIVETSHQQQFFCNHLPKLTDNKNKKNKDFTFEFLYDMVSRTLKK